MIILPQLPAEARSPEASAHAAPGSALRWRGLFPAVEPGQLAGGQRQSCGKHLSNIADHPSIHPSIHPSFLVDLLQAMMSGARNQSSHHLGVLEWFALSIHDWVQQHNATHFLEMYIHKTTAQLSTWNTFCRYRRTELYIYIYVEPTDPGEGVVLFDARLQ